MRPDQPDEETRRIAYRHAPAWAIEAGWENPDAPTRDLEVAWWQRQQDREADPGDSPDGLTAIEAAALKRPATPKEQP